MSDTVRPFRLRQCGPVLAMTAVTGFVESILVWRVFHGELPLGYAAAAHLLILTAIAAHALAMMRRGRDLRLIFILFCFTLAAGPAGAPATFLTAVMTSVFARKAKPFEEWYSALFPDEAEHENDLAAMIAAAPIAQQNSIIPLIDVLTFGSHAQKQALLTLVTSNFKPAFAAVLKTALNDTNNAIRVQAATGITKIENDFMSRAVALSRSAEESPEDPELLNTIARHYDEYAYIGLLDPDRQNECRRQALSYYNRYLSLVPDNWDARIAAGRLLVRDRRYEQAVDWFEQANFDESSPRVTIWYLESLFRTGRFEKLRSLLAGNGKEFQDGMGLPLESLEATRLWLVGEVEGKA